MTANELDDAERWRRRYERERAARRAAEQLASDTMRRLHLQLQAVSTFSERSVEEQKADFLSVVSHELRTPVTILRGGLHVLERRVQHQDPTLAQVLGTVARASDRLVRIVQNVEVSARLRDTEHVWGLGMLDLSTLIRQVVEEVAPEHGVRIHVPDGAQALASGELLRNSLSNLLQNAITYGRPAYEIRVTEQESTVELRVIDHGDGLPEGRVDLFLDFAQGDIGDRRTSRGLGLGLSNVVGAAVRGGWHIEHLRNAEDHAAIFLIRLPNAQTTTPDSVRLVSDDSDLTAGRPKR